MDFGLETLSGFPTHVSCRGLLLSDDSASEDCSNDDPSLPNSSSFDTGAVEFVAVFDTVKVESFRHFSTALLRPDDTIPGSLSTVACFEE